MIAVGIDPSLTSTGVGVLVDGRIRLAHRYGRPGENGASYTSRSRRIRKLIHEVTAAALSAGKPDVAVVEEHPYATRVSGAEFDRSAVWHGIFGNLDAHNVPVVVIANTRAKSWIAGHGGASKHDIIEVIDEWYADQMPVALAQWRKKDNPDDIADALGYATMGAFKLGDPIPFEPKPRHTSGIALLPWPKIATAR